MLLVLAQFYVRPAGITNPRQGQQGPRLGALERGTGEYLAAHKVVIRSSIQLKV